MTVKNEKENLTIAEAKRRLADAMEAVSPSAIIGENPLKYTLMTAAVGLFLGFSNLSKAGRRLLTPLSFIPTANAVISAIRAAGSKPWAPPKPAGEPVPRTPELVSHKHVF